MLLSLGALVNQGLSVYVFANRYLFMHLRLTRPPVKLFHFTGGRRLRQRFVIINAWQQIETEKEYVLKLETQILG